MKTKNILRSAPIILGLFVLAPLCSFNSGANDGVSSAQGQASSVGSPGEMGTCSRSGCHGAGSGGLADNTGPGSLVLTSVPAISGNQYVPGQLYHMTVTVAETGKTHFGFGCETLDNSGSTDGHVNNTAGTVTVTDAAHTRIWQAFGTGRLSVTHSSGGGLSTNSCSFIYDWTAPLSGTVSLYLCGNATNNNAAADAADNVYSQHLVLTPLVTGIQEKDVEVFTATAFPVPTRDVLNVRCKIQEEANLIVGLYNIDGLFIRTLDNKTHEAGTFLGSYNVDDLTKGVYFLRITCGNENCTKRIIVD